MLRNFYLIILLFFLQGCTVYKIINTTSQDQTILVGMKIHNDVNTKNNIRAIEQTKNVIIKKKSLSNQKDFDNLNYEIQINSKKKIKLTDLIYGEILSSKITNDSMDIRLSSGQPIFISSNSIKVNNFKRITLPWGNHYQYVISE